MVLQIAPDAGPVGTALRLGLAGPDELGDTGPFRGEVMDLRLWSQIREKTLTSSAPCLIYEEANLIKRAIRDLYTKDVSEVLVVGLAVGRRKHGQGRQHQQVEATVDPPRRC